MSKALLITRSFSQNSNLSRSFVVLLAVPLVSEELWVHLQLEEERKETKRGKRVRCLGPLHVHETGKAQKRKVDIVMSNTFGFGGHNTSLILGKYKN